METSEQQVKSVQSPQYRNVFTRRSIVYFEQVYSSWVSPTLGEQIIYQFI